MSLSHLKSIAKQWLPPILRRAIASRFGIRWTGNFASWGEASRASGGYDAPLILRKVQSTMLKVVRGEAAFERDSMAFEEIVYSFPLLAALQQAARACGNQLRVLDFGGSLGTTYFQNRNLLQDLRSLEWCVVEQPHFVAEGNRSFANNQLRFCETPEAVFEQGPVDFVLFSSSLQYLEDPLQTISKTLAAQPRFFFYDRTPLFRSLPSRLTVQVVPPSLYAASYPCWILNRDALHQSLAPAFTPVFQGETPELIPLSDATYSFGFFERRNAIPSLA
jgi:putative methyltransferase (TIGR04325 family)